MMERAYIELSKHQEIRAKNKKHEEAQRNKHKNRNKFTTRGADAVDVAELRKGYLTTDAYGNKIVQKMVKSENLPKMMISEVRNKVCKPSLRQMSLRSRFAAGICKILRRYITHGKEEEVMKKNKKLLATRSRAHNPQQLLSLDKKTF